MAVGTNAFVLTENKLEQLLPYLTYLRVNFSAGERKRYAEIIVVLAGSCKSAEADVAVEQKEPSKLFSAGFNVFPIAK